MIFSLFWEGVFIRRGVFIQGGAFYILKTEILGGHSFEGGVYLRRGVYSRKYGIHQIIGRKPKSLIEVAKMASEGKNQVSTATTNLLSFSQWSNKTNIQIFKITIQLVCQRPC